MKLIEHVLGIFCLFLSLLLFLSCVFTCPCSLIGGSDYKLIYRHYATLYFVFCVDSSESELGILDLIQVSLAFIYPFPGRWMYGCMYV